MPAPRIGGDSYECVGYYAKSHRLQILALAAVCLLLAGYRATSSFRTQEQRSEQEEVLLDFDILPNPQLRAAPATVSLQVGSLQKSNSERRKFFLEFLDVLVKRKGEQERLDRAGSIGLLSVVFFPTLACPELTRVGVKADLGQKFVADGGKWVCGITQLPATAVVYSAGSNDDFSFEDDLRRLIPNCELHIFDPTTVSERSTFHNYGVFGRDGMIGTMNVKSLPTIMRELGHDHVDLLKIDIEGSEWSVLDNLVEQPAPRPTILLIEVHLARGRALRQPFVALATLVQKLYAVGYRTYSFEPNVYCFACAEVAMILQPGH